MDYENAPSSNPLYRLVQVVTSIGIACFLVAGYLGLRALLYNQVTAMPPAMVAGAWTTSLIAAPPGIIYLLLGPRRLSRFRLDWISVQLGILFGGLLYGVYNFVTPFSSQMAAANPGQRFLQGGIDGFVIGALAGLLAAFVNGRELRLNRRGLMRYMVLFLAVLTILAVGVLVYRLGSIFNLVALGVIVVLLIGARVIFWNFGGKPYQEDSVEED